MRILVDSNVIVAALTAKGSCFDVLEDIIYSHTPVYTSYTYSECKDVLLNKFHLSKPTVKAGLSVLDRYFTEAESATDRKRVCRDGGDDQLLADARLNKVDIILTGDKDLLSLVSYEGVRIVSPSQYWKL